MKYISFLAITITLISCVSAPSKPEWVQKQPTDPKYYIGIGYSNTGIEGEDRELARKAALGEMASSISTSIKGELEVLQQDSSDGESFSRITNRIVENINHVLEGVSIFDSYYSTKDGYWVYMRFSKADFELQKQRLRERVLNIIKEGENADISKRISAYVTALGILTESPYIASIKDETGNGILLDTIESRVFDYVSGIKINSRDKVILAEPGKAVPMDIFVSYRDEGLDGIPVRIYSKNNGSEHTVFSNSGGTYTQGVDIEGLITGENHIVLSLDLKKLNIEDGLMRRKLANPEFPVIVKVDQLKARFVFRQNGGETVPGVEGMTHALFSRSGFPIKITDEAASLTLDVELVLEDFPRFDEKALFISQARMIVKIIRNGDTIYTYESPAQKDGGITMAQSYERTVKKLLNKMGNDQGYIEEITRYLGVE
ncbi:MAG: LPP20 family lipoprotein [Spirochaetales bacterium]|nr:LPP20 family lipoprotein [Spirochaetales bacterium]